jgi:hypothetical protein
MAVCDTFFCKKTAPSKQPARQPQCLTAPAPERKPVGVPVNQPVLELKGCFDHIVDLAPRGRKRVPGFPMGAPLGCPFGTHMAELDLQILAVRYQKFPHRADFLSAVQLERRVFEASLRVVRCCHRPVVFLLKGLVEFGDERCVLIHLCLGYVLANFPLFRPFFPSHCHK